MQEDIISLRVSREELAAVLSLLDIPSLPGMGETFLEGLNDNERALVLAAGRHALRAHGWMEEHLDADDGALRLVVDPTLLALVGECNRATAVIVVNRYGPTPPPTVWYIHHGAHLRIIHRIVASGVHEFVGTVDNNEIQKMVLSVFPFAQENGTILSADNHLSFRLAQPTLDEVITAVREDQVARAEATLQRAGLNFLTSGAFIKALQGVIANSMLARLNLTAVKAGNGAAIQSFSLIETMDAVWMLRPDMDGHADMLAVERASPLQFIERVERVLA